MVHFFTPSDLHKPATDDVRPIYHEATKDISALVGHECLPEDRTQREAHYRQAIAYANTLGGLGLEENDIDLFALYFTALSDSRRFGRDPVLDLVHGENPATHSVQIVALGRRLFDEVEQLMAGPKPSASALNQAGLHSRQQHIQLASHAQMTGLGVLMHDMGEVLGEFTTAVDRMKNPDLKEDPLAERTIFAHVLRMAMDAQRSGDREGFYHRVTELKKQVSIVGERGEAQGIPKSSEYLSQFLQPPVQLSPEEEQRFSTFTAIWDMAEGIDNPMHAQWQSQGYNVPFLHQLIKSLDHVQGTRHLVRWARRDSVAEIPDYGADRSDLAHVNENRVLGNMRYCEPEAAPMMAALQPGQKALEAVARQQLASIYGTISDLADITPPAPLGYHMSTGNRPVLAAGEVATSPDHPSVSEQKRAQGAVRGLYERAAKAALQGRFTPQMVDNGKGGMRGQLLGIDGLNDLQCHALYHDRGEQRSASRMAG